MSILKQSAESFGKKDTTVELSENKPFIIERMSSDVSHVRAQPIVVRGRGGVVVRLLAFPPKRARLNSRRGRSRIVPDDAAGQRISSGISRFPRSFILALLHTHFASPSSALKASMLRAAQIASLTHSPIVFIYVGPRWKIFRAASELSGVVAGEQFRLARKEKCCKWTSTSAPGRALGDFLRRTYRGYWCERESMRPLEKEYENTGSERPDY
ncbi:hypothetical protein PR048_025420 [Dryococelus australis]|uniref:Uncharacterized protein n=1 Tax=Dryococelus australis TaxID=614101 RepID=A0ABQ9GRA1_9NEOP|nr:hypothetical protein PR048_025420 [Dryococelus australis]